MEDFSRRIIAVVSSVPRGRVVSYGQVAAMAGNPRAARQVAWLLHSGSRRHGLPWHRVINSAGRISLPATRGGDLQRSLLEAEGVVFVKNRVDLEKWGWSGGVENGGAGSAARSGAQ